MSPRPCIRCPFESGRRRRSCPFWGLAGMIGCSCASLAPSASHRDRLSARLRVRLGGFARRRGRLSDRLFLFRRRVAGLSLWLAPLGCPSGVLGGRLLGCVGLSEMIRSEPIFGGLDGLVSCRVGA